MTNDDLSKSDLEEILDERRELLLRAADISLSYYPKENRPSNFVRVKDDGTRATIAEDEIGTLIVQETAKNHPWMSVLCEEDPHETNPAARYVWVADNLDGTSGYLDGNDEFCHQGGLLDTKIGKFILVAALRPVVVDPSTKEKRKELVTAIQGHGTYLHRYYGDGKRKELNIPLTVSDVKELNQAQLVGSRHSANEELSLLINQLPGRKPVAVGGSGLKAIMIAMKEVDGHIRLPSQPPTKPWDMCVELLVTEAGGKATDFYNKLHVYDRHRLHYENGLALSNGVIHDETLMWSHLALKKIQEEREKR
jgi:3'-phosphoadenosine 5'-phosphosulfate (PAPS) 3'-phosphatase